MLDNQSANSMRNWPVLVFAISSILFYIPFMAKFFMGDDWLWMANGLKALDDFSILLQRPIYGYFRPLSLAFVSLIVSVAGASPLMFGSLNLVLHALNVFLLFKVLKTFSADIKLAITASFLFSFYYLTAPVVAWISTAPDLAVTTLSLLMLLATRKQVESPNLLMFIVIVLIGFAAVLIKESGIVAAGLYFLVLLCSRQNPLNRKWLPFSIALVVIFGAYLIFYLQTRTFVDKEIEFGISSFINIWYLAVYTILPFSERIVSMVPSSLHWILTSLKILFTAALPVLIWYILRKGENWTKIFVGWLLFFIATVSLFNWDVSLFSLYPERTGSRYMYTPAIGTIVIVAWLLYYIWQKWNIARFVNSKLLLAFAIVYIVANAAVIHKVTAIYRVKQAQEKRIYTSLIGVIEVRERGIVNIYVPEIESAPAVIKAAMFPEAMIFVGTRKRVNVEIKNESFDSTVVEMSDSTLNLQWNDEQNKLILQETTN